MLTQERLKELLRYDPETGVFTWRVTNSPRAVAGTPAGCTKATEDGQKYTVIRLDTVLYRAHRLAWLYVRGVLPTHYLDHVDLNGLNNAWANLREATNKQNQENRGPTKSESGVRGVTRQGRKWHARIRHHRKTIRLGVYDSLADAIHARQAAERLLYTHSQPCRSQS